MEIKVIDSLMGSGKTESIINYMNTNKDKYIYITPYLDEIQRIKISCSNLEFIEPKEGDIKYETSKRGSLKNLLSSDKNIATTHALFENFDKETEQLLEMSNYTLVLDEVSQVVKQIPISSSDRDLLFNKIKMFNIDDNGKVTLGEYAEEYFENSKLHKDTNMAKFSSLIQMAKLDRLFIVDEIILMWEFPVEIFKLFKDVFILTYLFCGQVQKYYFDLYNIKYEYYCIDNYNIVKYDLQIEKNKLNILKDKIEIYEGNLNYLGNTHNSFSFNWYKNLKSEPKDKVKNAILNYVKNISKSKSSDIIWTTFKDYKNALKGSGYSRGFLSHNARATNDYRNTNNCIYLVNRYFNPNLKKYFSYKGIIINEELYAISEMIQFIWRSCIRDDKKIKIFIPSKRMRSLLVKFLNCEIDIINIKEDKNEICINK